MVQKLFIILSMAFLLTAAFAQEEKDVLFRATYSDVINAEKAIGSQACTSRGKVEFVSDGVQGKAVRLSPGARLTYDIEKNVDVKKGSVVFWMRAVDWDPAKQSKTYHWLFSMEKNGPGGSRIQFFRMPSPVFMYMIGPHGKALQLTNSGKNWKQGVWNCIAMTWGEGRAMLFINGKGIAAPKLPADRCPVDIGKEIKFDSHCGTTDFDNLVIYNRPLTPGEIEAIYLENAPGKAKKKNYKPQAVIGNGSASDWNSAVKIAGFLSIPELQTIPGTEFRASYGKKSLFFHFESSLKPGKYKKPAVVSRKTLWDVPCAEIFIRTGTGANLLSYHLAFNMYGQQLTLISSKEIPWKAFVKTSVKGQKWIADIEIPYESLKAKPPVPGDEWLMNFGRKFINPTHFSNPAVTLAYGNADKWWRVKFAKKPGAYAAVTFDRENNRLKYSLHNAEKTDKVSFLVKKMPMNLKWLSANLEKVETIPGIIISDGNLKNAKNAAVQLPGAGRYFVQVKILGKDNSLKFRQLFHFIQKESFAITPVFLSKDKLMNVQCHFNFPLKDKVFLKAEILNKSGKTVARQEGYAEKGSLSKTIRFDMSSWKELDYRVRVTLFENNRKTEERVRNFKCFYNAEWHGFEKKIGYMKKIPAPWVPLKINGNKIITLSQVYELGEDGLPAKVSAIGKSLLAGKIRLDLAGFKQVSKLRFLKKEADLVIWQTEFASGSAKAVLKGTMEFDGMIRYDLTISPVKNTVLKNLKLTIPAAKKFGKYFIPYDGPDQNWTVLTMKNDASKTYTDAFMPHLWTGGDDAGIAWFAESDEFYNSADERKVVTILPRKASTDMIIDMVGKDLKLDKPVTYTFGIQATPAKPMPDKWFNWALGSCARTNRRPLVTAGFTTGPEYHVYSGIPYPTQNDDRVSHYIKNALKANYYPLLHATTNGLGGKCPEFQFFEQEWKNSNFCDTWTMAARGEYYWGINTNSQSYRDFYLWSAKKAIDKFDADGFFYDFASVFEVDDPAGSCTYMRNGKKRLKWTIFSDRAIRRAMYQMVQDKREKAIFVFHNYSKPFVPILSFATIVLDGEPYQQRTGVIGIKVTTDYTKLIPIPRFRSMFGVQFGVIPYFLIRLSGKDEGTPEYTQATRTLLAMALPHGVPVWGFYCDIAELNAVMKMQDKFKIGESEFYSCFSEKRELKLVPEKKDQVLMGYWKKANGDYLIAVGNLTDVPYSGKIQIPGHKALEINVPKKDFLLIWIAKDGTKKNP